MRRLGFAAILASVGAFFACSGVEPQTADPTGGTGGTSATGGTTGGAAGTTGGSVGAGTGGVAGTLTTGGTSGAGGSLGGTAGSTAGAGGSLPLGGMAGIAGIGAVSGMAGGAGAGGIGTSGSAGQGGAAAGTAGSGGTAGTATAGAGGMAAGMGGVGGSCPSVAELFPTSGNLGSLDGRLVTTPCADTNSDDCGGAGWIYNGTTSPCQNGALTAQQDFVVGGTPGTVYNVTIHFYGIVEPKNYGNQVTRESGNTRPTNNNAGATPVPWAYTTSAGAKNITPSDYNTYELHILDNTMAVSRQYFINSDTQEGHWTYVLDYEKTIPVIGGGRVRFRTYDSNCRMIKNCYDGGQGSASQCGDRARSISTVTSAMPAPTGLQQPGLGNSDDQSGQWVYTDVVSVSCP